MTTIHDRLVAALEKRGSKRIEGRSRKYTTLTREVQTRSGVTTYYFVGRSGALRVGRTSSSSAKVLGSFKQQLLQEATP